jgi:hypothetical protein
MTVNEKIQKDALDGPAGIPEGRLKEARAIQAKALKGSGPGTGPAMPLGIWSRGCYFVETEEVTDVYKYGTYWKRVECMA